MNAVAVHDIPALERIAEIPCELIDIGTNVRVDPTELEGLAASIKAEGLAQPVQVVGPHADGRYRLVYGQRRLLASRVAELPTIRAIVLAESDVDEPGPKRAIVQLVENLQRADLNPIEEAVAMREVLDGNPTLTQQALADKLGRSPSWLANSLRLLETAPAVQQALRAGQLSAAHAKALAGAAEAVQKALVTAAVKDGWSAHELERQVQYRRQEEEREVTAAKKTAKAVDDIVGKLAELGAGKGDTVFAPTAYGEQSTRLQQALQAVGFKYSTGSSWPRPSGCDCKQSWRIEILWDGKTRASAGCIKSAHVNSKQNAEEARRRERKDRNAVLREALRAGLRGIFTADAVAPMAARFLVWATLGDYYREQFAKAILPKEKKPDGWAAVVAATDEVLLDKLLEKVVESTATWKDDAPLEAMLATLSGTAPTVQAAAAERVKAKRAARVPATATDTPSTTDASSVAAQSIDAPNCTCAKPKVATGDGRWVCTNPDHDPKAVPA